MFSSRSAIKSFALRKRLKPTHGHAAQSSEYNECHRQLCCPETHHYPVCVQRAREVRSDNQREIASQKRRFSASANSSRHRKRHWLTEVSFDYSQLVMTIRGFLAGSPIRNCF